MNQRTNPDEETPGSQKPPAPARKITWAELAYLIDSGRVTTVTVSQEGQVIKIIDLNQEPALAAEPEDPSPAADDEVWAPSPPPDLQFADKAAALGRSTWAFVRSLTVGKLIGFMIYAIAAGIAVCFWILPALAVVFPLVLGMSLVVFAFNFTADLLPDFPGKFAIVMLLFMLLFLNAMLALHS